MPRWVALTALLLGLGAAQDTSLPFDDAIAAQACHESTAGYLGTLKAGAFSDSGFFKCFRPQDQVYTFMDAMAAGATNGVVTKFNITSTVQGRQVLAYKLSKPSTKPKKIMYIQSTMHAREWIALTSAMYSWAKLLDGLATKNATYTALVDAYDWVYTPIVNLDGYIYSWTTDRYFRKNMQPRSYNADDITSNSTAGVDLNRNWGPTDDSEEDSLTYSGPEPFSEPEVRGLKSYIDSTQVKGAGFAGVLDIHSYGGLILTPYGNSSNAPVPPYGDAFLTLSKSMETAMRQFPGANYTAMQSYDLYYAQGMFSDYVFATYALPAIVIEIMGKDFRVLPSAIPQRGAEIAAAVVAYAQGIQKYVDATKNGTLPLPNSILRPKSYSSTWTLSAVVAALCVVGLL